MANNDIKKRVPVDFLPDELVQLDWLKKETKRTRAGLIKWLVNDKATSLGYSVPKPNHKK